MAARHLSPGGGPAQAENRRGAARVMPANERDLHMLASFLIGLVGGQRAMTPLAAVSVAAASGALPAGNVTPRILAHPLAAALTVALAAAELAGDKMRTAPDRIVPVGLAARLVTSAIAGAALVPLRQRWLGAAAGGGTALLASYPGWRARIAAIPRYGRVPTGLVEDAIVVAGAVAIVRALGQAAGQARAARTG